MEESVVRFKLDDEEEGGNSYEEDIEDLSEIDVRWCLVGRFLTDSPIDFQEMQYRMAVLRRPGKGFYIKEVDRNRYIFQFYHEVNITRILEGSPWTFGRFHLILERMKEGDNPRHGEKFIEKIFDTHLEEIEKPYGSGKNPVSFPAATTTESEGGIVATKSAVTIVVTVKVGEYIYTNEDNGLQVVDLKRCRIEEPIEVGLGESNSMENTDMTEEGKLENLNSKNEIMVGSSKQTFMSL
ncbi:hypothetical protein AgCh_005404 [Apium graveolens]